MGKFCEQCGAEYLPNIEICKDCNIPLQSSGSENTEIEVSKIYQTPHLLEAQQISASLISEGCRVSEEEEHISQIPTLDQQFIISVHPDDEQKALDHIRAMRHHRIISKDGSFFD